MISGIFELVKTAVNNADIKTLNSIYCNILQVRNSVKQKLSAFLKLPLTIRQLNSVGNKIYVNVSMDKLNRVGHRLYVNGVGSELTGSRNLTEIRSLGGSDSNLYISTVNDNVIEENIKLDDMGDDVEGIIDTLLNREYIEWYSTGIGNVDSKDKCRVLENGYMVNHHGKRIFDFCLFNCIKESEFYSDGVEKIVDLREEIGIRFRVHIHNSAAINCSGADGCKLGGHNVGSCEDNCSNINDSNCHCGFNCSTKYISDGITYFSEDDIYTEIMHLEDDLGSIDKMLEEIGGYIDEIEVFNKKVRKEKVMCISTIERCINEKYSLADIYIEAKACHRCLSDDDILWAWNRAIGEENMLNEMFLKLVIDQIHDNLLQEKLVSKAIRV